MTPADGAPKLTTGRGAVELAKARNLPRAYDLNDPAEFKRLNCTKPTSA